MALRIYPSAVNKTASLTTELWFLDQRERVIGRGSRFRSSPAVPGRTSAAFQQDVTALAQDIAREGTTAVGRLRPRDGDCRPSRRPRAPTRARYLVQNQKQRRHSSPSPGVPPSPAGHRMGVTGRRACAVRLAFGGRRARAGASAACGGSDVPAPPAPHHQAAPALAMEPAAPGLPRDGWTATASDHPAMPGRRGRRREAPRDAHGRGHGVDTGRCVCRVAGDRARPSAAFRWVGRTLGPWVAHVPRGNACSRPPPGCARPPGFRQSSTRPTRPSPRRPRPPYRPARPRLSASRLRLLRSTSPQQLPGMPSALPPGYTAARPGRASSKGSL